MFFSADISCSFGMDGEKVKGLWESYAKIVWLGQIMHFILIIWLIETQKHILSLILKILNNF